MVEGGEAEKEGESFFFTWRKLVPLIRSGWPPTNPFDITWQWGVMKWLFLIQPGTSCKNHNDKDWYWSTKKAPLCSVQLTTWCIWFPQTKGWRQKGTEALWTQSLPLNLHRLLLELIAVLPFHPIFTSSFKSIRNLHAANHFMICPCAIYVNYASICKLNCCFGRIMLKIKLFPCIKSQNIFMRTTLQIYGMELQFVSDSKNLTDWIVGFLCWHRIS